MIKHIIIMGAKMTLDQCECNHDYKISSITLGSDAAKERFESLGIIVGAILTPLCISPKKATMSVQVNQTLVAMRSEEAKHIKVESF